LSATEIAFPEREVSLPEIQIVLFEKQVGVLGTRRVLFENWTELLGIRIRIFKEVRFTNEEKIVRSQLIAG
jgi:hypothetical protein